MLIGILSDSHGRTDATRDALQLLGDRGAGHYLHCGDVGGVRVLDLFAGLSASIVWGNNDWDRRDLARYAAGLGLRCGDLIDDLAWDGLRVAVAHGDDPRLLRPLLLRREHHILCLGHTHVPCDHRDGPLRIVNPGALHRANPRTVALLDSADGQVRWFDLASAREIAVPADG